MTLGEVIGKLGGNLVQGTVEAVLVRRRRFRRGNLQRSRLR